MYKQYMIVNHNHENKQNRIQYTRSHIMQRSITNHVDWETQDKVSLESTTRKNNDNQDSNPKRLNAINTRVLDTDQNHGSNMHTQIDRVHEIKTTN